MILVNGCFLWILDPVPGIHANTRSKPSKTWIPNSCFQNISAYRASMAHKTNHSFLPNCEFGEAFHPRYLELLISRVNPPGSDLPAKTGSGSDLREKNPGPTLKKTPAPTLVKKPD